MGSCCKDLSQVRLLLIQNYIFISDRVYCFQPRFFLLLKYFIRLTDWFKLTTGERISSVTLQTRANRYMIMNGTDTINSAGSRTRILALFANASLISRTIRMDNAFWTTVWRGTDITDRTGTRRRTVNIATLRVRSAR